MLPAPPLDVGNERASSTANWFRRHAAGIASWLLFWALFVLCRTPALLNAADVNSDGAITGLQALRILQGEWSWLHWGRTYLTSIDSVVAAPLFAILGPSALTLMLATLLGQLTGASFVYAVVRKRIGRWNGIVALVPIICATMAFNIYLFFDIRQWCLALALGGLWLLDGASASSRPLTRYAAGVFVGVMAIFADLFAVQFMPGLALFAVLCALDDQPDVRQLAKRLGVLAASSAATLSVIKALRSMAHVSTERAAWSINYIPSHLRLLWDECLPWLIGYKIWVVESEPRNDVWKAPPPVQQLLHIGAVMLLLAVLAGGASVFYRRIPWKVRRVGFLGFFVACTTLAGFLVSATATDLYGARILAPLLLTIPFALTPLAHQLRGWRFGAALSPYLVAAAVSGWVSYGRFVDGIWPVRVPRGTGAEEAEVGRMLRERGIQYAAGHYWLAYRLTFLYNENPIVVPIDSEDRYPKYREGFDRASKTAYIFHPWWPFLSPSAYELGFQQRGKKYEKIQMYDFTIYIVQHDHQG